MKRKSMRNIWAITTSSMLTKSGICLFPMYCRETVKFLDENAQFQTTIMILDNYKECCDIFWALNKKCFENETEDMLLREIVYCKKNLVNDLRQHLLEAIIKHSFKSE